MKRLLFLLLFIISSLTANIKDIKTYQADFEQIIKNTTNNTIVYKGKLYIKNPSFILWRYNEPIQKDVYINYTQVTIIEPELEQAIVTTLQEQIDILKLIQNAKKISLNKYKAKLYNIEYTLTIENNILQKVQYKDNIDNNITIAFSNIDQNKGIPRAIFRYSIPDDYDIIRK
ncbi:MAG: LolA-like outer membrane lipoprotein chaperone [Campylobacterota bacterium]|nr:LolA-like outer membrane lipoprotein chaperone [Campylobacterota bacterium]